MNKRLAASALAALSTASVLGVVGAQPASAAPGAACGVYPPGLAYVLVRAPSSGVVHAGTVVSTRGTLRRGGQACVGWTLGFYLKSSPATGFRLRGSGITSSTGSVHKAFQVNATSRFFYSLNLGNGNGVRSGQSQIIAR